MIVVKMDKGYICNHYVFEPILRFIACIMYRCNEYLSEFTTVSDTELCMRMTCFLSCHSQGTCVYLPHEGC